MNIVIEGIDNSYKSTLVRALAPKFRRDVYASEGPPKYVGETEDRARKFLTYENAIFDRHPCVSGVIYGHVLRKDSLEVSQPTLSLFYDSEPVIIYCRPVTRLDGHVIKKRDTVQHLSSIEKNYDWLLDVYDEWAKRRAHINYRWGDNVERILAMLKGVVND